MIVGFGLFALFKPLTILDAWQLFGVSNGEPSIEAMIDRINRFTRRQAGFEATRIQTIGSILVATPIFFDKPLWVDGPRDWPKSAVQGKTYDLALGEGRRIWQECLERAQMASLPIPTGENLVRVMDSEARGKGYLVQPRLGQGLFRLSVADAYGKCAVSREHSLPALDAAHIRPFSDGGPHELSNGLLLRADIHRLFDRGYVTITPDYRFRVSSQLDAKYHNGKIYYEQDGESIWCPDSAAERPSPAFLEYHNEEVFLG